MMGKEWIVLVQNIRGGDEFIRWNFRWKEKGEEEITQLFVANHLLFVASHIHSFMYHIVGHIMTRLHRFIGFFQFEANWTMYWNGDMFLRTSHQSSIKPFFSICCTFQIQVKNIRFRMDIFSFPLQFQQFLQNCPESRKIDVLFSLNFCTDFIVVNQSLIGFCSQQYETYYTNVYSVAMLIMTIILEDERKSILYLIEETHSWAGRVWYNNEFFAAAYAKHNMIKPSSHESTVPLFHYFVTHNFYIIKLSFMIQKKTSPNPPP